MGIPGSRSPSSQVDCPNDLYFHKGHKKTISKGKRRGQVVSVESSCEKTPPIKVKKSKAKKDVMTKSACKKAGMKWIVPTKVNKKTGKVASPYCRKVSKKADRKHSTRRSNTSIRKNEKNRM